MLLEKSVPWVALLLAMSAQAAPAPSRDESDVLVSRVAEPESPNARGHLHDARNALIDLIPAELIDRVAILEAPPKP